MPHKGNISKQANKMSVENAGFTCVGENGTIAMVWAQLSLQMEAIPLTARAEALVSAYLIY